MPQSEFRKKMLRLIGLCHGHISSFTVSGLKGVGTPAVMVPFDCTRVGFTLGQFPVGSVWLSYVCINEHKGFMTA